MNTAIVSGNLGQDPEMFYTNNGDPIASFNLAVKSGKDKTSWIKVTAFTKLAEICETYLHKGAKVIVNGSFDQDKWEKDGVNHSAIKIIAFNIEFIKTDGRGFENGNQQGNDIPF